MKLVVYIDVYVLVNGIFDFCILMLTGRTLKCRRRLLRLLAGAVAGGLGAAIILVCSVLPLSLKAVLQYGLLPGLMVFLSFGFSGKKQFFHQLLSFYGIACLLGGILVSLGQENQKGIVLIIAAGITVFVLELCLPAFQKRKEELQNEYEVAVRLEEGWVHGKALLDTGNRLKEPFSGKPVVLAEFSAVRKGLSKELQKLLKEAWETGYKNIALETGTKEYDRQNEGIYKIHIIPYRAVGTECGLIPAIEAQEIKIWTEKERHTKENYTKEGVLMGIVFNPFARGEYQFILHEDIMC